MKGPSSRIVLSQSERDSFFFHPTTNPHTHTDEFINSTLTEMHFFVHEEEFRRRGVEMAASETPREREEEERGPPAVDV